MNPYWTNGLTTLYRADARAIPLPDASVHCVVTSPPYYQLRRYKGQDERYLGAEGSPEEYLENLLVCFREVRRVLREDGVCWVNIGDTRGGYHGNSRVPDEDAPSNKPGYIENMRPSQGAASLQRLGIPERFALAMQADGWVWRDSIVWAKPSVMPESVSSTRWERCRVKMGGNRQSTQGWAVETGQRDSKGGLPPSDTIWAPCPGCPKCLPNDGWVLRRGSWRTTHSHEMIYMFVKGAGYYSDGEAVKTAQAQSSIDRYRTPFHPSDGWVDANRTTPQGDRGYLASRGANRRSVWSDVTPEHQPSGTGHYATFPTGLPRICIQASTSEAGVCATCGNQWARMVEHQVSLSNQAEGYTKASGRNDETRPGTYLGAESRTIAWRPACGCPSASPVPATVLDPFGGMMTTCVAAQRLGRRSVGLDLSEAYLAKAQERLEAAPMPLVVDRR